MTVHMTISFPTARRRDASNLLGTLVKATVDGLTDAGLVAGRHRRMGHRDTAENPGSGDGWHQVTVEVEDRA